jgi:hypothetical protein
MYMLSIRFYCHNTSIREVVSVAGNMKLRIRYAALLLFVVVVVVVVVVYI